MEQFLNISCSEFEELLLSEEVGSRGIVLGLLRFELHCSCGMHCRIDSLSQLPESQRQFVMCIVPLIVSQVVLIEFFGFLVSPLGSIDTR